MSTNQRLRDAIFDALRDHGESLLDDAGVDEKVIAIIADQIIEKAPAPRVLIEVSGGNVQMIYATAQVDCLVKDWDNIKAGDAETYLESANGDNWSSLDEVVDEPRIQELAKESVSDYIDKD